MSAAVSTARTPASALARLVSMRLMRACACGLRSSLACSRPLGFRSATYGTWPVTFSGPSGRGMESPTPLTSRVVFITLAMPLSFGEGGYAPLALPRFAATPAASEIAVIIVV